MESLAPVVHPVYLRWFLAAPADRPHVATDADHAAFARLLAPISAVLGQHPFLLGDRITTADIVLGGACSGPTQHLFCAISQPPAPITIACGPAPPISAPTPRGRGSPRLCFPSPPSRFGSLTHGIRASTIYRRGVRRWHTAVGLWPDAQSRRVFAGRFAIEREAGQWGMGTVYAARDLHTDRPVALKLLQLGGSFTGDVERFSREAAVPAELDHPGIVSHVAHGTAPDGQRYLAMEWLDGEDLGQRLRCGSPADHRHPHLLRRPPLPSPCSTVAEWFTADSATLTNRREIATLGGRKNGGGNRPLPLRPHGLAPCRSAGLPGYRAVLRSSLPGRVPCRVSGRPGLGLAR